MFNKINFLFVTLFGIGKIGKIPGSIASLTTTIFLFFLIHILYVSLNIITQTPKISKYKNKIIKCISDICGISKNKINVKGKTTEKLGLIGKEKAIACEVITSVIKYD